MNKGDNNLLQEICDILMEDWDPIGVNQIPEAEGEYDSYGREILRRLEVGAEQDEIDSFLRDVELSNMGLDGSCKTSIFASKKILRLYSNSRDNN